MRWLGAGASSAQNIFTALLQDNLRHFLNDTDLTLINCAVSGYQTPEMYRDYATNWIKYRPVLTVINASYNDNDTALLRTNLETLVTLNKQHGIKTLFIEEPNEGFGDLSANNHKIMRSVASANHMVPISVQPYLESYADSGFLWWDGVHLSDYGHILFANRVFPFLVKEISADSSAIMIKSTNTK